VAQEVYELDISKGWVIHAGERIDPFDVIDALGGRKAVLYLHDMDCRSRYRPQLDLIQDMSPEVSIWYDGAFRYAEWIIDPLVSGAEMVVLNAAYMRNLDEYRKVMTLSGNVAVDAASEHEDRITDYARQFTGIDGILRLNNLGYEHFILPAEDIAHLDNASMAIPAKVWVRGEMRAMSNKNIVLMGNIKSIEELMVADE